MALRPNAVHGLLILEVSRSHTTTHHIRQDSSGRVIISSQRLLPDNTQHSQQTNIHAPDGIRTYDLSRRAVAELRLRPRGHWDRLKSRISRIIYNPNGIFVSDLSDSYPAYCGTSLTHWMHFISWSEAPKWILYPSNWQQFISTALRLNMNIEEGWKSRASLTI